ncbi:hypothetical protein CUMW_267260 [Citrus unshiu]|uniref:Leucine-rich repeat-containing N-terminal plant-type domain-containing protein n=1 Tax=Citrus unshiu TaxID=55188 RepID=A0A2H5QW35_CITUN|nr:hypothetical protein CUMW_267260 [Citrus unshiu]
MLQIIAIGLVSHRVSGMQYQRGTGSLNFSCFSNLQYINLWNNDLSGSIPPQIGSLLKLKYLNLRWKNLTEIGKILLLQNLDLSHNNLSDSQFRFVIPYLRLSVQCVWTCHSTIWKVKFPLICGVIHQRVL